MKRATARNLQWRLHLIGILLSGWESSGVLFDREKKIIQHIRSIIDGTDPGVAVVP
jgi:hypothetical protein